LIFKKNHRFGNEPAFLREYAAKTVMRRSNPPHAEMLLLLFGSSHRTCSRAGAAINAFFRVDYVFTVFFGNCTDRTSVGASAASDAFFGVNYIRHNILLFSTAEILKFE